MLKYFNPFDWYWQAADGRLFSSSAMKEVSVDDKDFKKFVSTGGTPTVWPKSDDGQQTNETIMDVLSPYGITPDDRS